MERPPPGAKTTLLIVAVASALGIAGIVNGVQLVRAPARPDVAVAPVADHERAAVMEANDALARAVAEALVPRLRGLGAVDAIVSLLLAFAAFSLFTRRPQAPWWMAQAALANAAYAIVWCAVVIATLRAAAPRLSPLIVRALEAQKAGASHDLSAGGELTVMVVGLVLVTALSVLFYLLMAWRVRRPDIRALMRAPDEPSSAE